MGLFGGGKSREQSENATQIIIKVYGDLFSAVHDKMHPYDAIILFFNATSTLQDNFAGIQQAVLGKASFTKKKEAKRILEILKGELAKGGRSQFGWNRTSVGEQITEYNVYLGNVNGLFTKTIAEWKTASKENQEIVTAQARDFIQSYKELPDTLKKLLSYIDVKV